MKPLFASDLSKALGIGNSTARAWLKNWEVKYGNKIVGRIGNRRFTTINALAKVLPNFSDTGPGALALRTKDLEKRVDFLEEKVDLVDFDALGRALDR